MDSSSSSSSSSSQAVSSVHLGLAALFGASVMAISAFYIHKRSVDQVLDRLVKLRRRYPYSASSAPAAGPTDADADADRFFASEDDGGDAPDGGGGYFGSDGEIQIDRNKWRRGSSRSLVKKAVSCYRVSSSMPNVGLSNEWLDDDAKCDQQMRFRNRASSTSWDKLNLIPSGLPPLQTARKDGGDQSVNISGSKMRMGSTGRLITPRSSGGYAFGSTGDSDEEGTELATGEDILFTDENINSSDNSSNIQNLSAYSLKADNRSYILDHKCRAIAQEAKANVDPRGDGKVNTASVHIVGNDPVFANTMFPLTTTVHESMNKEEEEVWKMIRECLDLRENYVYREEVAPWKKATVGESCGSGTNSDPFCFVPAEATAHHFRMEDGVVHIYASENDTTDLFPVASSTTFFTDMHHLLKVISIGNVRSACHHRLRFLEEIGSF